MLSSLRRTATALGALAILAAPAVGTGPSPAAAQAMLDFGRPGADDALDGGDRSTAPFPTQSAPRSHDVEPNVHRPSEARGFRYLPRSVNHYVHTSPSVSHASSTYYRGTGIYANANPTAGSVVVLVPGGTTLSGFQAPGPKFIDVEADRLDRQPIPAKGISTHYVGSAKIIRIASNYRMNGAERRSAALPMEEPEPSSSPGRAPGPAAPERIEPRPEPTAPAPETAEVAQEPEAATAEGFEPWTDEWLRHCVALHDDFDASLGTYTDDTGRRRFCTGDPA